VEGDAEELPFADDEFDRVLSVFGAMFAPRHERTAAELLRVTRPGGTLALATWTPGGVMGQMIAAQGTFIPPPEGAESPALWGDEEHARAMLAGASELTIEPGTVTFRDESVEHYLAGLQERLGPLMAARAALDADGRWPQAQAQLHDLYSQANTATDGSMSVDAAYLLILARP
jgi:SAM-dependent methyltransferase